MTRKNLPANQARQLKWGVSFAFALLLVACSGDAPEPPSNAAEINFTFDVPLGLSMPIGVKPPVTSVAVSYVLEGGEPVLRQKVAVESTATGYVSSGLSLTPGRYQITELFALDGLDQAYGVVPMAGSYYGDLQTTVQTLPFTLDIPEKSQAQELNFQAVGVFNEPADYGYADFPTPSLVPNMDFSYRVLNESGEIIPSFLMKRGHRYTSSAGSSSAGWGDNPLGTPGVKTLYQGLVLSNPKGYYQQGQLVYLTLQVGAYGYEDSPVMHFFPDDLDTRRQTDPVFDIVLRAESSLVELTPAGFDQDGRRLLKARLAHSQFLEQAQAQAGAAPSDKYSYTIGFTLSAPQPKVINGAPGWITESLLKSPSPSPVSSTFYTAPYDSSAAQAQDAYPTLEAELIVKDEAAWAVFNDSTVPKTMQVYVEMLMLKGDGSNVIHGDEEFLGFESKVIKVGPAQIHWNEE